MPSVTPGSPSTDLVGTDEVSRASALSHDQALWNKVNSLLSALGRVIRDDDTLVDQVVRHRNLAPEILATLASSGFKAFEPVRLAATSNVDITTGGLITVDGRTAADGDRILLTAQTDATENGVYVAGAGTWSRATDLDAVADWPANHQVTVGISEGATQAGRIYVCKEIKPTPGTSAQTWVVWVFGDGSAAGAINVRHYGAVGDGVTDDTSAIEAAWAALLNTQEPFAANDPDYAQSQQTKALYFPPGTYRYTGTGLTQPGGSGKHWAMFGDHSGCVRIDVESDVWLITLTDPRGVRMEGFSVLGGKGLLKCTNTGNNVGAISIIRDVRCFDYTVCAVGNNADDHPQLVVDACFFQTKTANNAIAIAWGGLLDAVVIRDTVFFYNKYAVKLGPKIGGSFHIGPNNTFIGSTGADIWIVPRSDTSDNTGRGSWIYGNKHGNESITLTAPKVLIAAEAATVNDRLDTHHSTTVDTAGYVNGVTIEKSLFAFATGYSVGLIQSYVQRTALIVDDIQINGTLPPYIIEAAGGLTEWNGHYDANDWYVGRVHRVTNSDGGTRLSNVPGCGPAWDLSHQGLSDVAAVVAIADDVGVLEAQAAGKNLSGAAATDDPFGGQGAGTLTFNSATPLAGPNVRLPNASISLGRMVWADLCLRKSGSNPLDEVLVVIKRNDSSNRFETVRRVRLTAQWQRVAFPFMLKEWDGSEAVRVILLAVSGTVSAGATENVDIAWMRVYHSRSALPVTKPGYVGMTDADFAPGVDTPEVIVCNVPLTAGRAITLVSANGIPGQRVRVERTENSTGAFNLTVGGKNLATRGYAELVHIDGAWVVVNHGTHS